MFALKQRNKTKSDWNRKLGYLLLRNFLLFLPKFYIWKRNEILSFASTIIWDFTNI